MPFWVVFFFLTTKKMATAARCNCLFNSYSSGKCTLNAETQQPFVIIMIWFWKLNVLIMAEIVLCPFVWSYGFPRGIPTAQVVFSLSQKYILLIIFDTPFWLYRTLGISISSHTVIAVVTMLSIFGTVWAHEAVSQEAYDGIFFPHASSAN